MAFAFGGRTAVRTVLIPIVLGFLGRELGQRAGVLLGRPDELERDLAVARDLHAA